jgi:hypothetical protein
MADWLATVRELTADDSALAREVAECPPVIKGYGDTHVCGRLSYDAIMYALPKLRGMDEAAGHQAPSRSSTGEARGSAQGSDFGYEEFE